RIDRDLATQPVVQARLLQTMGRVYTGLGLYDPAIDLLQRATALRVDLQRAPTPEGIATANALGAALFLKGEYDAARPVYSDALFREALRRYRLLLGDDHPFVASILNNLGRLSLERGEVDEAKVLLTEALAIDRKSKNPNHEDFIFELNSLGLADIGLGKPEAAVPLLEEARRVAETLSHRLLAQVWSNLADAYWRVGRTKDAFVAVARARPLLAGEDYVREPWYAANLDSIEGAIRTVG